MQIMIQHSSVVPIYEQIIETIKQQIIKEKLKEGEMLPSTRALAKELKISALTVKKSYDVLDEEGFITTVHGKGSFVAAINPEQKKEEQLKEIENEFANTIEKGCRYGIPTNELAELFQLCLEEKND